MNVVIPILIFVIMVNAYEIELIGVVPSVDIIENDTPKAIKNKPNTNEIILLIILFTFSLSQQICLLDGSVSYVYILQLFL